MEVEQDLTDEEIAKMEADAAAKQAAEVAAESEMAVSGGDEVVVADGAATDLGMAPLDPMRLDDDGLGATPGGDGLGLGAGGSEEGEGEGEGEGVGWGGWGWGGVRELAREADAEGLLVLHEALGRVRGHEQ